MRKIPVCFILLCAVAVCLAASSTLTWEQKSYEEFEKGTAHQVSIRSDGKVTLAPRFREVADPGLGYIWAVAEDKRGNVYLGGGSPAKVVRVTPAGGGASAKTETVFAGKELEVHALAVDGDNNIYAATSPDPKIYRITPDGKHSVFFEPPAKYVWALAFDPKGQLLVATGDKGEVWRVDRGGQGSVFFKSDETHARSLVLDKAGNILIGTDPGGLVLRVTPDGQAFILYQAAKREVTALEVGPDGSIYAAVVGDKQVRPGIPGVPPPPAVPVQPVVVTPQGVVAPTALPAPVPVAGGTEVYRLFPDGHPRRLWSSREEVVYALALTPRGHLLLGTGNRGKIFQLEQGDLFTSLVKASSTQVTAFVKRGNGAVLAATSNIGKLMEIGGDYEVEGTLESETLDSRHFAQWGRVFWRAEAPAGAGVAVYTRSGNVDNPDRNWSPWSAAMTSPGVRSPSPGARFLQWKAVLTSRNPQVTPWLDIVEIAYLPKNVPPVIEEVEVTPPGFKFQAQPGVSAPKTASVTLPPLAQNRARQPQSATPPVRFEPPATLTAEKGAQGVRWAAQDENNDELVFALHLRGKEERDWRLLKDKITEKAYTFDSTAFPDGVYHVKLAASDAPSNAGQNALTDQRETGPFTIDNTPPRISGLQAAREGGKLRVTFRAADALSTIKQAEYSVDGSDWKLVLPVDEISDSLEEEYNFTVDAEPGERVVAVRVSDRIDNTAVEKIVVRDTR